MVGYHSVGECLVSGRKKAVPGTVGAVNDSHCVELSWSETSVLEISVLEIASWIIRCFLVVFASFELRFLIVF